MGTMRAAGRLKGPFAFSQPRRAFDCGDNVGGGGVRRNQNSLSSFSYLRDIPSANLFGCFQFFAQINVYFWSAVMTLMESRRRDIRGFQPRLVLWCRGAFVFGASAPKFEGGGPELAFRLLRLHRHRLISYRDWEQISPQLGLSDPLTFAVFVAVQSIIPVPGCALLRNPQAADPSICADILGLVLVLTLGSIRSETTAFVKTQLHGILSVALLCNYYIASEYLSEESESIPALGKIPISALVNLDPLLEGTVRIERHVSTASIVPKSLSALITPLLGNGQTIDFNEVCRIVRRALQMDMFALEESPPAVGDPTSRTMTSTQLAEHRKLTIRNWSHMELLTKPMYRGSNLRIRSDSSIRSPLFCPRALRSVSIVSSNGCGPIILGPVKGLVLLRDLHGMTVSVICERIFVEKCKDLTIFVNSVTAPIIGDGCTDIRFGPYNCFYDGLAYELRSCALELLDLGRNQWNEFIQITKPPGAVRQITSDDFYIQPTPFAEARDSAFHSIFLRSIPTEFLMSFDKRKSAARSWVSRNPEHKVVGISDEDRTFLLRRINP